MVPKQVVLLRGCFDVCLGCIGGSDLVNAWLIDELGRELENG